MDYIRIAEGGIREGLLLEGFLALRFGGLIFCDGLEKGVGIIIRILGYKTQKIL